MVFVSLEGFVGSAASRSEYHLPISRSHELACAADDASLHVVVTPGSPAKKHANDALRRPRFGLRALDRRSSTSSSPLLLYVTDSAANDKWVLVKSADDYQELRKGVQHAIGACHTFSCCGPLRRIAKSPIYKPPRRKRSDSAVASQFGLAQTVQEFVNDLLLAVFAREHQCENTAAARLVIESFLDIAAHRAAGADRIMRRSSTIKCAASDPANSSSHDTCECPICCSELSGEQTLQLPCSHVFHSECVRVWLNMQHTCPVCRVALDGSAP